MNNVKQLRTMQNLIQFIPCGPIAKSVTSLTADPGVASSILAGPILSWRLILKSCLFFCNLFYFSTDIFTIISQDCQ